MSPQTAPHPHIPAPEKVPTGISGFDQISEGGLPKRRSTLLVGTPGAGKTIWAMQFLAEGIRRFGEPGVFITFEEDPQEVRLNMRSFGWDLAQWEAERRLRFVDASAGSQVGVVEYVGDYDLEALMARVEKAIRDTGATRVVLDSIGTVLSELPSPAATRRELNRLIRRLKALGVTTVVTAEQTEPTLHAVSEFVADNVVLLRNELEEGKRRRTIEVLKQRGSSHHKGQFSLAIVPGSGISVIPLATIQLNQSSSNDRIHSGSRDLDAMLGGGLFQDSVVLVSGPTGSGKTLTCSHFLAAPVIGGPHMVLAFEESRDQLVRNARSWGSDFEAREKAGELVISCEYPESRPIEDHLIQIKLMMEKHKPSRLVVDSLTALERVCSRKAFREFVINLTSYVKQTRTASLFTATTPWLKGGESMSETHISSMTDTIILLRYIEVMGRIRRGIAVLKMRGSAHDNQIREFTIDGTGMRIGAVCLDAEDVLAGGAASDAQRLQQMFDDLSEGGKE